MDEIEYRPGLDGVPAVQTRISFLDLEHEQIIIRGYDLIELAKQLSYLEVGYLLLYGDLPQPDQLNALEATIRRHQAAIPPDLGPIYAALGERLHPMDALRTGISALAADQADQGGLDPLRGDGLEDTLIRLWALVPVMIAQAHSARTHKPFPEPRADLPFAANFLWMLTGVKPSPLETQVFDRLLILYSEHEMPNSTFAARVIASSLADPYGALTGAVAALKGPLHGGANEAVMQMLQAVSGPEAMEAYLLDRLQAKARIMGFGHRVYMHRPDPRAVMTKALLADLVSEKGGSALKAMCEVGERVMREQKGLYPNLDYYAAPVYHLLGIATELFTPIFFAARTAGLAAHLREQYGNNRLFRPRVIYLGPRGLTVKDGDRG